MDKIPMNLEQTVQYLLDEVNKLKAGIAPGELIPGPQGVQGPEGQKPEVSISNATGNWVIDGVDTGKPSRGKQGEKGNTGMQGVPGVGVSTMLSIDSTEYTPTVTDDGAYQDVESSAEIKYSDGGVEHSTQVDFNIKVPKVDISGKLDKVTTTGGNRLYAVLYNGQQTTYTIMQSSDGTTDPTGAGIPYQQSGYVAVRTPNKDYFAANKKYVDDAITDQNHVPYITESVAGKTAIVPYKGNDGWTYTYMYNDPIPYAIAQRNSKGTVTGCQDQLYVHYGTISIEGTYVRYKIINKVATAFTNVTTAFPENGNIFTLRTGPKVITNFWYDDSDGTWYYSTINNPDSEGSSYSCSLVSDAVYEF